MPSNAQLPLLLLALLPLAPRADFLQSTYFTPIDDQCSGPRLQAISQLMGCTWQGPSASFSLTCTSPSSSIINVFSTPDCSGPSSPTRVPVNNSCAPGSKGSGFFTQRCIKGAYSASREFAASIRAQKINCAPPRSTALTTRAPLFPQRPGRT